MSAIDALLDSAKGSGLDRGALAHGEEKMKLIRELFSNFKFTRYMPTSSLLPPPQPREISPTIPHPDKGKPNYDKEEMAFCRHILRTTILPDTIVPDPDAAPTPRDASSARGEAVTDEHRKLLDCLEQWLTDHRWPDPDYYDPALMRFYLRRMVAALSAAPSGDVPTACSDTDLIGYRDAWYEICTLLDIPAMAMSPKQVHESIVMPKLRELLRARS